jgi:hypothetical protein
VPLCGEEAHEMSVWFLSKIEMERCVPFKCGEDAQEMGVSFEMK